jgi:hypothetical protein
MRKGERMAGLREAELALRRHSRALTAAGAWAITVGEVTREAVKHVGVIAFFRKRPRGLPRSLKVNKGARTVQVPLAIRIGREARPE